MAEVHSDTKPIEPVGTALSFYRDRGDQKKYQPLSSKRDNEKELEDLSKELANCKVQLETKHAARVQALRKLEHKQKMTHEMSTLLNESHIDRKKYLNECIEGGRARKDELESRMKEMADQQLEDEVKGENHRLIRREHRFADKIGYVTDIQPENRSPVTKVHQTDHSKAEAEERNDENKNGHISIPLKNYDEVQASVVEDGSGSELAFFKKELEVAMAKIAELRYRAEQALSRAELAEKAKAELEDKLKRQRERRQRKRAALAALREASTPRQFSPSTSDGTPRAYQPLGSVLNMKL